MAAGNDRDREEWKTSGLIKTPGIPAPSGDYKVGCLDLMDETGLLVRLFYPTSAAGGGAGGYQYAKAVADSKYTKATLQLNNIRMAWLLTSAVSKLADPRSPALEGAPLYGHHASSKDEQDTQQSLEAGEAPALFPVVVFSHGLHACRTVYSGICSDIASNGYVVAALEHKDLSASITFKRVPGRGVREGDYDKYVNEWIPALVRQTDDFPFRNQQLEQRQSEVSKALDLLQSLNEGNEVKNLMGGTFDLTQFTGRLDTNRAAVMGHSFGGGTTVKTLAADNRFKCGIALDTWMFPVDSDIYDHGINQQPLIFINSYSYQWPENVASMMKLVTPPDETGISKCSLVTLKGTNHYTQTDGGFVVPRFLSGKYASENPYEANAVNSKLSIAFLKRYLLKDPGYQDRVPLLDGGEGSSELVLYGTNVDWKKPKTQEGDQGNSISAPVGDGQDGEGQGKDTNEEEPLRRNGDGAIKNEQNENENTC